LRTPANAPASRRPAPARCSARTAARSRPARRRSTRRRRSSGPPRTRGLGEVEQEVRAKPRRSSDAPYCCSRKADRRDREHVERRIVVAPRAAPGAQGHGRPQRRARSSSHARSDSAASAASGVGRASRPRARCRARASPG
jgi:hypothetical protein